jgi:hypothetical protein
MNSSGANASVISPDSAKVLIGDSVKLWVSVFVLASLALFTLQPTALVAGNLAVSLMFAMAMLAQNAVAGFDGPQGFGMRQRLITLLDPIQFACMIWLAVYTGRLLFGTMLFTTSVAALAALAMIVMIDAVLSVAFLIASERGKGVSGVSVAALISSKYAGLLGKIA